MKKNLHFIFLKFCTQTEYTKLIREEISKKEPLDYERLSKLPILDSFIKEAVRLNPLDKREPVMGRGVFGY